MKLIKRYREGGDPAHLQWGNERTYWCLCFIATWGARVWRLKFRWRKRNNPGRRPNGTGPAMVLTWRSATLGTAE